MGRHIKSDNSVRVYKAVPELNCKPVELYAHNKETYDEFMNSLLTTDILAVVQATGTGKSFIFMKYIQEVILNNSAYSPIKLSNNEMPATKRIVVVVPNDSLRVGYSEYPEWDDRVEVITYQKLSAMYEQSTSIGGYRSKFSNFFSTVGVLIFDEMHRTGAEKWGEACKAASNMLITRAARQREQIKVKFAQGSQEYNKATLYSCDKVLGFTATPIRDLDNNRDMVDEMFKGHCVSGPDLSEAVAKGILPKFSYHSLLRGDSYEKVNGLIVQAKDAISSGRYEVEKTQRLREYIHSIELNMQNSMVIEENIRRVISRNKVQKWIVFCSNAEEMNSIDDELYSWFNCVGSQISIYRMLSNDGDNNISKKENMENLKMFISSNTGVSILKVINMLNEGVHVKGIDGAILMRGTNSLIMYLQQIGRVLSASGNKTPIVIDFMGNYLNIQDKMKGNKKDKFKRENIKINHYIGKMCCGRIGDGESEKDNVVGMQCVNIFNDYYNIEKELKASRIWTEEEERIVLKHRNDVQSSYVELLGIGNNRTQDAVKAKWRELAGKYGLEYDSGNRLTEDEKRDMLYKHIAEGKDCNEIASELGCDAGRVSTYLSKAGVNNDIRSNADSFSAGQFADMIKMRSLGAGWKKIADKYGTSDYIVKNLFKRAGMEDNLDGFGKKKIVLNKSQIQFMRQCIGAKKLSYGAEVLGISLATIKECFDRQGEVWAGLDGVNGCTQGNSTAKAIDDSVMHKGYYKDTKIPIKTREQIAKSFENCGYRMDCWVGVMAKNGKPFNSPFNAIKVLRDTDSFRNRQSYDTLCAIYKMWTTYGSNISSKDISNTISKVIGSSPSTVYNAAKEMGLVSA